MFILSVSSLKCYFPSQQWTERRKLLDGMERWSWIIAVQSINVKISFIMSTFPSPPSDLLSEHLLSSGSSEQNEEVYLQHCVCYGLGHFASCVSARYQLAMFTAARDTAGMTMSLMIYMNDLSIQHTNILSPPQIPVGSCSVYDPVFLSPSVMPSKSWASPCWLKMRCTHLRT